MSQEDVYREAAIAKAIDERFKKIEAVVFAQPSEEKLEEVIVDINPGASTSSSGAGNTVTITDPQVQNEPITGSTSDIPPVTE